VDLQRRTPVERALKEPGIPMIPAYSRQARGRSERRFATWQGRLPPELRLAGVRAVEEANRFRTSVPEMNRNILFRPPTCPRRNGRSRVQNDCHF